MNAIGRWTTQSRQCAVFLTACCITCAGLRVVIKSFELNLTAELGWLALAIGSTGSWWAIQRWRHAQPLRCAVVLGILGGIGGAGLITLLLHLMIRVLSPPFQP
jgi:hypothetical protein